MRSDAGRLEEHQLSSASQMILNGFGGAGAQVHEKPFVPSGFGLLATTKANLARGDGLVHQLFQGLAQLGGGGRGRRCKTVATASAGMVRG